MAIVILILLIVLVIVLWTSLTGLFGAADKYNRRH